MLAFYFPVALAGFVIFGENTQEVIIGNMDKNWLKTGVIILITGHLLTAFNIILNPVYQGFEHSFSAPNSEFLHIYILILKFVLNFEYIFAMHTKRVQHETSHHSNWNPDRRSIHSSIDTQLRTGSLADWRRHRFTVLIHFPRHILLFPIAKSRI